MLTSTTYRSWSIWGISASWTFSGVWTSVFLKQWCSRTDKWSVFSASPRKCRCRKYWRWPSQTSRRKYSSRNPIYSTFSSGSTVLSLTNRQPGEHQQLTINQHFHELKGRNQPTHSSNTLLCQRLQITTTLQHFPLKSHSRSNTFLKSSVRNKHHQSRG